MADLAYLLLTVVVLGALAVLVRRADHS